MYALKLFLGEEAKHLRRHRELWPSFKAELGDGARQAMATAQRTSGVNRDGEYPVLGPNCLEEPDEHWHSISDFYDTSTNR